MFSISGNGYNPVGDFSLDDGKSGPMSDQGISLLLYGATLCNDAKLEQVEEEKGEKTWRMVGDPTEGAMVVAAAKGGLSKENVEKVLPRVNEIPFDSERKRMVTVHELNTEQERDQMVFFKFSPAVVFVKGAPDMVLDLCENVLQDGEVVGLDSQKKDDILKVNRNMAQQALRVLGVAGKPLDTVPDSCDPSVLETKLTFIGLMGMIDPARPEVKDAVKIARDAGLKTVMVTGDYKDTAEAVAKEIGLLADNGKVFTGVELDKMSDDELIRVIDDVNVCCRVSPHNKTQIVDALKAKGHVVAMTGDGVNDAPALKRANIGIAMGITGSDVSKETSDMVLTDDNFASIVSAIEEGRTIYANIRKFVNFLLVCNVGEILIVFFSMILGMGMPFKPIMLLWLNLVTDGAPALALGLEKPEPNIMRRPPRPAREPVINRDMAIGLVVVPIVDTIAVLSVFAIGLSIYPDNFSAAQTMTFVTLCLSELLRAYTARSEQYSVFTIGVFSNRYMQWAVLSSIVLVLMTIYIPFLRPFFGTFELGVKDWLELLPFVFAAPVAAELVKIYLRKKAGKAN